MAGTTLKKRSRDDAPKSKPVRPSKKQRKQAQAAYHSSSESASEAEDGDDFQAVNLLDSDSDDIHNAHVDDGAESGSEDGSDSESEEEAERAPRQKKKAPPSIAKNAPESKLAKDAPSSDPDAGSSAGEDDDEDEDDENDEYSDLGSDEDGNPNKQRLGRSKRGDPTAFATSMSKILSTKLSTSRRADPVLARSAAAHEASRQAVDAALETKARKKMREQKQLAFEKGRVRDVLVATNGVFTNVNPVTGEVVEEAFGETTAQVLETERRLRKVAQRGVVQLFNAFRTAQVKAAEAERVSRKEGIIGVDRKKDKVTEMSKKGFLDLIASGGGGLKKGPMEEA